MCIAFRAGEYADRLVPPRMTAIKHARALLPWAQRFRSAIAMKRRHELRFWLEEWDPVLRGGGFFPSDALALLGDEEPEPTYIGRRWQQARAEVRRG
jgi:hypothetical protein